VVKLNSISQPLCVERLRQTRSEDTERRKSVLQGDLRGARLCCGLALLYVGVWRHISLNQVKARAHCSEGPLILFQSLLSVLAHSSNFRPCLPSFAIENTLIIFFHELDTRDCSFGLPGYHLEELKRCATFCCTPQLGPTHLGSLHGFVSSPICLHWGPTFL